MKPDELIPKRRQKAAKSSHTKPAVNKDSTHLEPNLELTDTHQADASVSNVGDDKALRARVSRKVNKKRRPLSREGFFKNHIVPIIVTFLLSGVLGAFLTYYLSVRQKELEFKHALEQQEVESKRRLSEEMNKIRLQKIVEVWEKLDETESEIDKILERITGETGRPQSETQKDIQRVHELVLEQSDIIKHNRFWLGDELYDRITKYLEISGRYATERLVGPPGIDLSETLRKRAQAKQNIVQIMEILNKESVPIRPSEQPRQ